MKTMHTWTSYLPADPYRNDMYDYEKLDVDTSGLDPSEPMYNMKDHPFILMRSF